MQSEHVLFCPPFPMNGSEQLCRSFKLFFPFARRVLLFLSRDAERSVSRQMCSACASKSVLLIWKQTGISPWHADFAPSYFTTSLCKRRSLLSFEIHGVLSGVFGCCCVKCLPPWNSSCQLCSLTNIICDSCAFEILYEVGRLLFLFCHVPLLVLSGKTLTS